MTHLPASGVASDVPRFVTVGHSTRSLAELVALLRAHGVRAVADVRRFPASRRHPHLAAAPLAAALVEAGLLYRHLPALGGRRRPRPDSPHTAWRQPGFRGYADHMETAEFAAGLAALVELAATRPPVALLCAEAAWWRCHRRLIADALVVRGEPVAHLLDPRRRALHRLPAFARVTGGRLLYAAP